MVQITRADNVCGQNVISSKHIIWSLIDLLRHPLISPYLQTDTTPPEDEQGRKVRNSNIFSGEIAQWIQADVRRTSQDENALAVFLSIFSDGSQMTRTTSLHPVKFSLMSVPEALRNAFVSKYHLTYLSKCSGAPRSRKSAVYKRTSSMIFTRSFDFLLAPLIAQQDEGFFFRKPDNTVVRLVARLLMCPNDTPEVNNMLKTKGVYNTPCGCPVCMARMGRDMWVANDDGRSRFPFRTVESMKEAIDNGLAMEVSIHPQRVS